MTSSLGSLSIDISLGTAQLEKQLSSLEDRILQLSDVLGNIGSGSLGGLARETAAAAAGFELIGNAANKALGAISGYAKGGVDLFVDFNKGLNTFAAVSNATEAELKVLNDTALQLAKDTTKTAPEVARAAVEYSKLGFSAKDTAKELGGLVALAEAAGVSVEESASIVGAGSSIFGRSSKEIANIVATTSNATAANATDMLQAFSKAGGVFQGNNQDLETLSTSFGLLRSAGFSAESAGTALKTSILSLAAPSKNGSAALDTLGVAVRDGEGNLRNFLDLIPEFRNALANVDVKDRAQLTKDVFGTEAGPAIQGLLGSDQGAIDTARTAIGGAADSNAAADTAAKMMQGLPGTLEALGGSLETLQLKIGESLAPLLTSLATGVTSVVNAFLALPAPVQGAAIGIAGAATAITALIAGVAALNTLQVGASLAAGATQAQALVGQVLSASTSFDLFGASSGTALKGLATNAVAGAASMAKLVGVAGAAVLAGYAISEAWNGLNLALGTDASTAAINADTEALRLQTDELLRGRGELELLSAAAAQASEANANLFSQEGVSQYFEKLTAAMSVGGPIEVLQTLANDAIAIFFDLDAKLSEIFAGIIGKLNDSIQTASGLINLLPGGSALTGAAQGVADAANNSAESKRAAANDVRDNGLLTTNSERQAENTGGAITKQQEEVNRALEAGNRLLNQYQLSQNAAANAEKLSATEKVAFTEEAKKQIAVYDSQIAALKRIKPANDEQRATINAEISSLEKNKKAYQDRVAIVDKSTKSTEGATKAQVNQASALGEEAASVLAELKTDVAARVAAGVITEEQGQNEILAKEKEYYDQRIALNKEKIAELLALKDSASEGELLSINKQIGDLEKANQTLSQDSSKAQTKINKNNAEPVKKSRAAGGGEEAAIKKAQDDQKAAEDKRKADAQKAEQFIQQQEQSAVRSQEANALNAISQGVLSGSVTPEEAAVEKAKVSEKVAGQEITAEQNKLARMKDLLAAGVIDKETAASQELQIGEKLAQLELRQTEARIAVQEAARKKILQDIADANKQAEAAIQLSGTERTTEVKVRQATGGLSEADAAKEIAKIEAESTIASQNLIATKIAQVQQLKSDGTLTEREANEQLMTLEQERANLNLKQVNEQIAARAAATKAALDAIDLEGRQSLANFQQQQAATGAVLASLKGQQDLLNAQQSLTQAQDNLALQRLQEKGASEQEIAAFKQAVIEKERVHAVAMLEISLEMKALESEREIRSSRIAENEAQIALMKAKANGASAEEIALLEQSLKLRQDAVGEAEKAAERQAQIGQLQRETLNVQQTAQKEKEAADAKAKSGSGGFSGTGGSSGGGSGGGVTTSMNLFGDNIQKDRDAAKRIEQLQKSGATEAEFAKAALGSAGNNEFFLKRLQEMGLGDIVNLANANNSNGLTMEQKNKVQFGGEAGFGELLAELKNLNGNVTGALKEPKNISLSTATPTKDLLDIMGQSKKRRG